MCVLHLEHISIQISQFQVLNSYLSVASSYHLGKPKSRFLLLVISVFQIFTSTEQCAI